MKASSSLLAIESKLWKSLSAKQQQAIIHLDKKPKGIVWWKVGEGKTRIALCWLYFNPLIENPKPIIICSPGAIRTWQDEIYLLGLEGILKPKFISYGLLSRKNLELDFQKYNCLIIDELWLYKNHKSNRSVMIRQIASRYLTIGLSGSMVTARNIEDLYGQAKAVCLDELIAVNITQFRRLYEIEMTNRLGFIERTPKKHAVEQIQTQLAPYVHLWFPRGTREIKEIPVNIEPLAEQIKLKRQLVKDYYYEYQKNKFKLEVQSAATMLIKLQQISDGFLRDNEGHVLSVQSAKQARLRELCFELIDAGERILIWTAFRQTLKILAEGLPFPVALLSSEHRFDAEGWKRGRYKVCIATVGSGASLNDFANIRYALFYSTRFSHIQMQQAKGRTDRRSIDIKESRYYYYLQTEGFPDRRVYEMIKKSCSMEEMVIMTTNEVLANEKSLV